MDVAYILIAIAPFQIIYLGHWLTIGIDSDVIPTGFIQYDMPYYSANGREIFERGNGFAYPNPYDSSPTPPIIYFQWPIWLLGFAIKKLNVEPGIFYFILGIIGSLLSAYFTILVVKKLLPDPRFRILLFFLVMWGGGFLCLAALIDNIIHGNPIFFRLFRYDPGDGLWFLNWGRNLIYPLEAIYHGIVAATWLAVLNERWFWAIFCGGLLGTAHPFSGVQLLLILTLWFGILACLKLTSSMVKNFLVMFAFTGLFLAYYKVFLNSVPQHQAIHKEWSIAWTLPVNSMIMAYSPVALLAAGRIWIDREKLDRNVGFLFIYFLISLLLAKHDLFISPIQPLHFTRGYIWTPLCLIALPLIQKITLALQEKLHPYLFRYLLIMLAGLVVSDNLTFIKDRLLYPAEAFFLTREEKQMLTEINQLGLDGVLLSPEPKLSYLSATYTSVRPYLGHTALTPQYEERLGQVEMWRTKGIKGDWFDMIDYILIKKKDIPPFFNRSEWIVKLENDKLILLVRKSSLGVRRSQN